jgi:hypothetical protein
MTVRHLTLARKPPTSGCTMSTRKYISIAAGLLLGACSSADITAPTMDGTEANLASASSSRFGVAIAYVLVGGGNIDWYAFDASDETGAVRGNFRLYQVRLAKADGTVSYATVDVRGTTTCMKVDGNKARLGGVITRSDFSGLPVGTSMTWSVTDNGSPSYRWGYTRKWDTASSLYAGVDPAGYCALGLAYPEEPVYFGDLNIDPT